MLVLFIRLFARPFPFFLALSLSLFFLLVYFVTHEHALTQIQIQTRSPNAHRTLAPIFLFLLRIFSYSMPHTVSYDERVIVVINLLINFNIFVSLVTKLSLLSHTFSSPYSWCGIKRVHTAFGMWSVYAPRCWVTTYYAFLYFCHKFS